MTAIIERMASALALLELRERELREAKARAEIARQEFKQAAAALMGAAPTTTGSIHLNEDHYEAEA